MIEKEEILEEMTVEGEQTVLEEMIPEEQPVKVKETFDKKTVKKDVSRIGWGMILYMVLLYGVVMIEALCQQLWYLLRTQYSQPENRWLDAWVESAGESAVSMIVGVGAGLLVLGILMNDRVKFREMFREQKKMTWKRFLQFLSVFMAVQLLISYFSGVLELILNSFGYTAMPSIEAAQSSSTTISMFLYASFVAPVVEELVYRGFLLGTLKRYGKMPAIIISAIIFGIMHGNIPQAIFAFCVGMVLGFVATEYSLKWAILIHMMNNFVFGEIPHLCGQFFGEKVQMILNVAIIYGFFFVGSVILWKNRKKVRAYVAEHKEDKSMYLCILTTLPIIIYIGVNLWIGIAQIQPLPSVWGSMV